MTQLRSKRSDPNRCAPPDLNPIHNFICWFPAHWAIILLLWPK
uniref:Uncharacterized protein n=1 Tax=Rhizophora mucronata TaxID=61149 RepID=A0A2P2NSH2_RHIMU